MKRVFKLVMAVAAVLGASLIANTASAATISGHIVSIFVSASNNLPFRVNLDVETPDCPSGIFYVGFTNENYQAYVSSLLLAYSLSKTVLITYTPGQGGYCMIQEFRVS